MQFSNYVLAAHAHSRSLRTQAFPVYAVRYCMGTRTCTIWSTCSECPHLCIGECFQPHTKQPIAVHNIYLLCLCITAHITLISLTCISKFHISSVTEWHIQYLHRSQPSRIGRDSPAFDTPVPLSRSRAVFSRFLIARAR